MLVGSYSIIKWDGRNKIPITALRLILMTVLLVYCACHIPMVAMRTMDGDGDDTDDSSDTELLKLYGTEVSWPMQHLPSHLLQRNGIPTTTHNEYQDYSPAYTEFMNGCYDAYDIPTCHSYETIRIQQNAIQPPLFVPTNYTRAGYAKVVAPITTFTLLRDYWNRYSTTHLQYEIDDRSGSSSSSSPMMERHVNVHINHWVAPPRILYLDPPPPPPHSRRQPTRSSSSSTSPSSSLPQMSISNRQTMIDQVQSILEQWTGVPLQFTSMYGIRSYTNHSILAPHIDRIPLVISAIINVAQHVTDDWVLELIGHDGYATNITMQPGEMIMYESHSILHGRPYPLNGQYYANCFFHFEPIGYTEQYYANLERHKQQQQHTRSNSDDTSSSTRKVPTTQEMFEAALAKLARTEQEFTSTSLSTTTLPSDTTGATPKVTDTTTTTVPKKLPYSLFEGTIEAQRWQQAFEFHRVTLRHDSWDDDKMIDETMFPKIISKTNKVNTIGATSAHILAAKNDLARLREVAKTDPKSLDKSDINGWLPLHEAARGGCTEVVQYLVEEFGIADINARTNNGKGGTALWWAEHGLPEDHKVVQILKRNGAISIAPFQKKKNTGLTIEKSDQNKNDAGEETAEETSGIDEEEFEEE